MIRKFGWVVGAAMLAASGAQAQTVTLRIADGFPPDHFVVREATKPFMKQVEDLTKGALKFEHFSGGQLGKPQDYLRLTQSGVTDIAFIAPSYISDKMPLSGVAELPGVFKTACEGTLAYWKLTKQGPIADELAKNKIIPLIIWILPPYQILTRTKPINSADSLGGMKLRTSGGAMDVMAKKLGVVSIRMAAPDAYESLSRGTLDGVVFPLASVPAYGLTKLVKYSTDGENFGSFVAMYGMNADKFKALPEASQKALRQVGDRLTASFCKSEETDDVNVQKSLVGEGVQFIALPAAEHAKVAAQLSTVADDWARGLDGRGEPGSKVLADFRAALSSLKK